MKHAIVRLLVGFACMLALAACSVSGATTSANTAATPAANAAPQSVATVVPTDLQWESNPNVSGVQSAVGVGDSTKVELYAMFGKMAAGAQFPPHTHPDARITTVMSGVMYYGVGEKFDEASIKPYPAGSVVYTPAGVPHFMWAKDGETVMQETGFGPTGLQPVPNAQ